jgi:hypothetical protein
MYTSSAFKLDQPVKNNLNKFDEGQLKWNQLEKEHYLATLDKAKNFDVDASEQFFII